MYRFLAIFVGVILLFSACSVKEQVIETSQGVKLIIKTPSVKLSGIGFYKRGGKYANLQIFSGGVVVLDYKSAGSICINDKCMTRGIFNEKLFIHTHYDELIDDILARKPIYDSQNLTKTQDGFSQRITEAGEFDILYEIDESAAKFNDLQNSVIIEITKLGKEQ
ncbi:MAG: hypothetical protein LBP40_05745 [Campylobacteraceae bacterium]|jgi:hypothetical protein|nr:hypothetical protein [Campylobacteraceae bacterium]